MYRKKFRKRGYYVCNLNITIHIFMYCSWFKISTHFFVVRSWPWLIVKGWLIVWMMWQSESHWPFVKGWLTFWMIIKKEYTLTLGFNQSNCCKRCKVVWLVKIMQSHAMSWIYFRVFLELLGALADPGCALCATLKVYKPPPGSIRGS